MPPAAVRAGHRLIFPELPSNLYSRPTLVWKFANAGGLRHRLETSYLAGGLSWNADYVLTVHRDDRSADLDGWVTLTNKSGTLSRDATLQLVAGVRSAAPSTWYASATRWTSSGSATRRGRSSSR
jgi:hypothetical protein